MVRTTATKTRECEQPITKRYDSAHLQVLLRISPIGLRLPSLIERASNSMIDPPTITRSFLDCFNKWKMMMISALLLEWGDQIRVWARNKWSHMHVMGIILPGEASPGRGTVERDAMKETQVRLRCSPYPFALLFSLWTLILHWLSSHE
jgi:hypothetical protein